MSYSAIIKTIAYLILVVLAMWGCHSDPPLSYTEDIQPILNEHCLDCHGGIKKLGGFSLLFEEEAFAPTESGRPAIVRGNAAASEIVRRLRSDDPELRMPQDGAALPEADVALIERWINEGAQWDQQWAYRPITHATLPEADLFDSDHPIDRYVSAKLEELGLHPARQAPPEVLIRRLSLDLLGLPPKPGWVSAFVSNPDQTTYEQIVDSILASPHFGERFAAMWLDLARYADSNGYEKDMGRSIWRYRDWVINAFNQNLPFDTFTIDQLAGDLRSNPGLEQYLATAFHRNTMTNTEGGTEDEEFRTMSVIDRVNTTFEVWQASTMSCVQCHSHPYDPLRHEDYYRLLAFFDNSQDADLDSEYPYLLELDNQQSAMQEWAKRITAYRQMETIDAPIDRGLVRKLIFPRLMGDLSDDFQHVLIYSNGTFNNSSYNANNQKHKDYYILFRDIPLENLKAVRYHYYSKGDDARIDLILDSIGGHQISQASMLSVAGSDPDWQWKQFPVTADLGEAHDLLFHFVNTTGDFYTGVVQVQEIELVYDGAQTSPALRAMQDSLLTYYRQGLKTPVMKERSPALARTTHVFERGNHLVKGARVTPGVPEVLNPPEHSMKTRLDLANWLVNPNNPLTARVIVNRFWEQIFGRGIVETLEDFGSQGEVPTHPLLLDDLAHRFVHQWDWQVKSLLRFIVTSHTYQQAANTDSLKLEIDPYNRYYSHGSRVRLSAEQIRDQALFVSGLINTQIGGPSVMPPQPEGVWQVVYSNARWEAEDPQEQYRRALYTYWKRTTPYPSMVAFDSPSREFCVSRRIRTNTPLQALVTLNDPVYIEAATALGQWMQIAADGNVIDGIRAGYAKALYSEPDEATLTILKNLYDEAAGPHAKMISYQEDAETMSPWTVVANTIMNLDAFLNKS